MKRNGVSARSKDTNARSLHCPWVPVDSSFILGETLQPCRKILTAPCLYLT